MSKERESLALPADTKVGRYRLGGVQKTWGFYLTYLAEAIGSGSQVFVHELLPEELVRRATDGTVQGRTEREEESMAWARERFVIEGRGLSACAHPGIQKILEVFEANGTAYWVTPMEEGRHFKRWLQDLGRAPTEAELRKLLDVLLPALQRVHAAGLYHLNLKPETIQIASNDQPVLVHFAGSRQAIARHSHAASAVTTGYSPIEQYDEEKTEGAWTDIYSLAAVLHRAITGQAPPEATERLPSDPYKKLAGRLANQYSADFLRAIDAALAIDAAARPRSIEGWQRMLGVSGSGAVKSIAPRNPRLAVAAGIAVVAVLLGAGLWQIFRPKPVPPIKHDDKKVVVDDGKKDEDKKRAEEEKKKAEEQRKAEEAKLAEAQKKAEADKLTAEKAAQEKAATEKQAEEDAAKKAAEAKVAAEKSETANAAADQATKAAAETKGAAKKKAADQAAQEASDKAADARDAAEKAARESAAAEVAAKRIELEKVNAERTVAQTTVAEKTIEEQLAKIAMARMAAEEKATSDDTAARKVATEKIAAEQAAKKIGEEDAAARQILLEKIAAEKAAYEALNEALTVERNSAVKTTAAKTSEGKVETEKTAAETAARKASEEKAAAEKAATDAATRKVAEEKAATDRAAAEKKSNESSQGQRGGPPPPPPSGGDVGQVGSGLGGVWETMGPDGKPVKRLIIYPDAYYELVTTSSKDSGIIRAKLGNISMDSEKTRETANSTFKYKTMGVIETDGALGKVEWVRASANTPERKKDKKE